MFYPKKPPAHRLELVNRGGRVCGGFESLEEALIAVTEYLGRYILWQHDLGDAPGREYRVYDYTAGTTVFAGAEGARYVLRIAGTSLLVPLADMREAWHKLFRKKLRRFRQPILPGYPVPGVRKWRGGSNRYHRHMQTAQLFRQMEQVDWEEPPVRARLGSRPTCYDDRVRGDYHNHSWKRHRKTQYK